MPVVRHRFTLRPHYWQRRFIFSEARDTALVAGIRGGKTVCGSGKFLREVTSGDPGVSILSGPDMPVMRQTTLETIFHGIGPLRACRRCKACRNGDLTRCTRKVRYGQWPRGLIVPAPGGGLISGSGIITLYDGNRVLVRSGDRPDHLRGPAAKCWWVDEFTLCRPEILTILQGRTLDTGGRGMMTGTPKGHNWFYLDVIMNAREVEPGRVWRDDRWEIFRFASAENPGIDRREVERLAKGYSARLRAQELEGLFVDWGGAVFPGDVISACLAIGNQHWQRPMPGHRLVAGLDPAGKGRDFTVMAVGCATCRELVDVWRVQKSGYFRPIYRRAADTCLAYGVEHLVVDETSMGGQMALEEFQGECGKISPQTLVEGFTMTARSKSELIMWAEARMEEGFAWPTPWECDEHEDVQALVKEHRAYQWDDKDLIQDCVIAHALMCHPLPPLGLPMHAIEMAGAGAQAQVDAVEGAPIDPVDWTSIDDPELKPA